MTPAAAPTPDARSDRPDTARYDAGAGAKTAAAPAASAPPAAVDDAGLTSAEAARRLAASGPNEPAPTPRRTLARAVARPLASPLVGILVLASVVAAVAGQTTDAVIIVVMVLLSAALDFVQTYRSSRAAEALRSAVAPTATVL